MDYTIKFIAIPVELVAKVVLAILEINAKLMETLLKCIIYMCHQLFTFTFMAFNGIYFALNDLISFLLEFGHGIIIILNAVASCILFILYVISQVYETFFCIILALYSFTSSISKSLVKQVIFLIETLQHGAVLVVTSCALFLQSLPIFATLLFKASLTLIVQITQIALNNSFSCIRYIHDSFKCLLEKSYSTICDVPSDFYVGSFLLFIMFYLCKKIWQTYQRNGTPQYLFLLPHLFMMVIRYLVVKLHIYSHWVISLFTNTQADEVRDSDVSDVVDSINGDDDFNNSDDILNNMEAIVGSSAPSLSRHLQRAPLLSLQRKQLVSHRNGMMHEESNEENPELSARSLKAELERERDRQLCVVCQDKPKSIIILPCRHLCLCSTCIRNIYMSTNACPLCRQEIYDYMHVFF